MTKDLVPINCPFLYGPFRQCFGANLSLALHSIFNSACPFTTPPIQLRCIISPLNLSHDTSSILFSQCPSIASTWQMPNLNQCLPSLVLLRINGKLYDYYMTVHIKHLAHQQAHSECTKENASYCCLSIFFHS